MSRATTIKFGIDNFAGGLNLGVDESLLKTNESSNAENVDISTGVLQTGTGSKEYAVDKLNNIKTVMTYYRNNVPMLIVSANGSLWKYQDNKYVFIAGGFKSDIWDSVNYQMFGEDVLILTNGVDNVKVYNGAIRDLKREGNNSDPNKEDNKAPKGKFVEVHYERLFICSDEYVYISKDLDFDDFTTPVDEDNVETNQHGAVIQNYTSDGSKAIGMKVVFDEIIIFKERSLYKIFGSTPSSYQISTIFSNSGSIADNSIVATNKGAYFINNEGIYLYDGVNCNLVSQKILPLFKGVTKEFLSNACATIHNNNYVLALPSTNNKLNDYIIEYNLMDKIYTKKTGINVNRFTKADDKTIFVNDTGMYEYGEGRTYNKQNINSFWETPYSNFGYPNAIKEVSDSYVTCKGTGQIKISCTTEKKTKSKIINLTENEKVVRVNLNNKGRLIKFRFENIDGADFTIKNFKSIIELDED